MWRYFFLKEKINQRLLFSLFCSVYVVIFYAFLEPSQNNIITYNYPFWYDCLGVFGYFIIISFMSVILPQWYSSYFKQETWTLSRFTIWFLVMVLFSALFAFIFDLYVHHITLNFENIIAYFVSYQITVDLFTALPVYFLFMTNGFSIGLENVEPIDTSKIKLDTNKTLHISFNIGENKSQYSIELNQLYYITVDDNYLEIFYTSPFSNENKLSRLIIRNTLRAVEEEYKNLTPIFRCHKSYIVNLQKVQRINGNVRKGYSLILEGYDIEIPVSRNLNQELKQKLPHLFS